MSPAYSVTVKRDQRCNKAIVHAPAQYQQYVIHVATDYKSTPALVCSTHVQLGLQHDSAHGVKDPGPSALACHQLLETV